MSTPVYATLTIPKGSAIAVVVLVHAAPALIGDHEG